MKVLLFTHKSGIDGMGNAVLAKLAFQEVEYVLTETFDLQKVLGEYLSDGRIYDFDYVFVTDLWLEEPTLSIVAGDEQLKDKFFVFDHHKSALEEGADKYPFATIRVRDERGLASGTSLFYEYLVEKGLIDKDDKAIFDFSELTRKYDTWEWKTIYNDEMPHELTLLFDSVGCEGYIKLMYDKLSSSKGNEPFSFSELETMLITNKRNQVQEKLSNYSKKIYYLNLFGMKAGVVFIDYEYRNDLAEYLRQNDYDIDFGMFIALDYGTISYRNIKEDVNVRLVAEAMGGKGHDKAAASPISEEQKQAILNILSQKK